MACLVHGLLTLQAVGVVGTHMAEIRRRAPGGSQGLSLPGSARPRSCTNARVRMVLSAQMGTFAMTAKTLVRALGGYWVGNGWMACCPAHNDTTPSLSLRNNRDGKVLARCRAGRYPQPVRTLGCRITARRVEDIPVLIETLSDSRGVA